MNLPNCPECHNNKRVEIVEALADDEYMTLYRVCCSACGGDWTWQHEYDPEEQLHDAITLMLDYSKLAREAQEALSREQEKTHRYEAALKFYANAHRGVIGLDDGERARKALEGENQ